MKPITLSPEAKKQAIASVRRFFAAQLEQDIGDLKADLVLDYFLREVAPSVYNTAINDAQVYFRDRAADLEAVCYQPEFTYWPRSGTPRLA